MEIIAMSDIGNVRSVNQDYVRYYQKNENEAIVVLCDGMGGHNAGEIAAQMTCDDIIEHYINHGDFDDAIAIQVWMQEIINHANQLVKKKSLESDEYEGMGTTVVIAVVKDNYAYISHVGDSRAYIYQNKELVQLTKDDTLVNVLIDSGTISKDEALFHPQKNILLQAVGVGDVLKISFVEKEINDDLILICSDGLYNSLLDPQVMSILDKDISLDDKGKELMLEANTFGGKDNIGFAVISRKEVINNESNK